MEKRHLQMVLVFVLSSSFAGCGGGGGVGSLPTTPKAFTAGAPFGTLASSSRRGAAESATGTVDIDAGSSTAVGQFAADTDFTSSGFAGVTVATGSINTSKVTNPAPQAVYQTQRYATGLTYKIPNLKAGASYTVRMDFVESFFNAAKKRIFSAKINGVQVLTNFDVFQAAGGENIAIAEQFVSVADATGAITIALDATVNNASIAALEITPVTATPAPAKDVMAINAGGSASGTTWVADTDYVSTGWAGVATVTNAIDTSHVVNPAPQAVYQDQRWAYELAYTIPKLAPSTAYTVRLHFVESYWTAIGQRVFNILINGNTVLSNFDIFKAAGGQNIALTESFGAQSDANGTIAIQLNASVDNATLAALEIISGGTSSTPSPTPTPTVAPTAAPGSGKLPYVFHGTGVDCMPATNVPYGHCPFISSIANEQAQGNASVAIPSSNLANWWSQQCLGCGGGGAYGAGDGPIYVYSRASGNASNINAGAINTSANAVTAEITNIYGTTPWNNAATYLPSWAVNSAGCKNMQQPTCNSWYDQHMAVIDLYHGYEIDGWYCANVAGGGTFDANNISRSSGQPYMSCLYGAKYPLGGAGTWPTSIGGGSAQAGGAQLSAYIVTPQEILNAENGTPIGHALSYAATCLGAPGQLGVWPARTGAATDTGCTGAAPYANYGQFLHLVSSYNIATSGYSAPCKAILQALQTYGAMLSDTGGGGWYINALPDSVYADDPSHPTDPWTTIAQQLSAGGDGSGTSGATLSWSYCLNRLSSADFEIVTKKQL